MALVTIRLLIFDDLKQIAIAMQEAGWNKPRNLYNRYLKEQEQGERLMFVAFAEDKFAGYVTVCWHPEYSPFLEANIPEIQDFNVLPQFRRQGIGTKLLDAAEQAIAVRSPIVGIGVGIYSDYGAAQRLYVKRGYIFDGRGLMREYEQVKPGAVIAIDDDVALYMTKQL